MQPWFTKAIPLIILLPPLCVLLFAWLLVLTPDRVELGPRTATITVEPVQLEGGEFAPLELVGAWKLSSDDPGFGGISGLAVEPGGLLALSDSGVVVRFAKPGDSEVAAFIDELPGGPASPRFRRHRDTEALLADPLGRGWWVGFENHQQLWLYDDRFRRALQRIRLGWDQRHSNAGVEALTAIGHDLIAIPEGGDAIVRIRMGQAIQAPLHGQSARLSDAAALPSGAVLLLERRMTWRGFANALVALDREGQRFSAGRRYDLPLGPLDNAEALAVEPLPGGAVRLWLMTDDNYQPPLRTLLIALDMPAAAQPDAL